MNEEPDTYDVIVLGAGAVGENVAQYAIQGSDRTCALVEDDLVGGECSYYACMPSKALLRPVAVASAARHLEGLTPKPSIDIQGMLRRRDTWTSHYDDSGQVEWAKDEGIEVVRGRGRLVGERLVEVAAAGGSTRRLRARNAVVIATGSVPVIPETYAAVAPWTSRDATGVQQPPGRLAIVGGGVVACEAATWMAALGTSVTLFVRDDRLLQRLEPFASALVADSLRDAGVAIRFDTEVDEASRQGPPQTEMGRPHGGPVTLTVDEDSHEFDEVLVATGRRPATDNLGLNAVGVTPENVSGQGEALPSWLHSVGDVSGEAPLTHWGKYRARLLGERIAAAASGRPAPPEPPDTVPVPQVVFTDPEVATVGMTEAEARQSGVDVRTVDVPLKAASGAMLLRDDLVGQARLVLDNDAQVIVGATFVGPEVAELLHSATVAIVGRIPLELLWHAVPSYPTTSEIWLRLLENARQSRSDGG